MPAPTLPAMQPAPSLPPHARHTPAWPLWGLWLGLLTVAALVSRSIIPLDETRYVSVAWEMWLRDEFILPYKNGEPYSHKAPLLFWMIHGGWAMFGVNEWWPRLLSPLLALANTWLTWRLARVLWPSHGEIARQSAWVLLGSLLWLVYAQALMFDMLITTCALLGLNVLAEAGFKRVPYLGLKLGLAIGLGLLAKGPALLVHLLPVALLAPWWAPALRTRKKYWYGHIMAALLLGAALVLAWAIPAAEQGGDAYRQAIFWGQTANRMVNSFAHQQPAWWYLATLPLFVFPWLAWPGLWRNLMRISRTHLADPGLRFTLLWAVGGFAIFSAISGKQPHYILPELPALALLIAFAWVHGPRLGRPWVPGLALMVLGAFMLWKGYQPGQAMLWQQVPPWAGAGFIVAGGLLLRPRPAEQGPPWISAVMLVTLTWLHLTVFTALAPAYDLSPIAQRIAALQEARRPVAQVGKYHAQFNFVGRLKEPIHVLQNAQEADAWIRANPTGVGIAYFSRGADLSRQPVLFIQPYRGGQVALIGAGEWHPDTGAQSGVDTLDE